MKPTPIDDRDRAEIAASRIAEPPGPDNPDALVQLNLKVKWSGLDWINREAQRRRISRTDQVREMLAYAVINMPKAPDGSYLL